MASLHQLRDVVSANFAKGKQTFIIPLTFADVRDAKEIITRIGYGGDVWEIRVDLLSASQGPLGNKNIPPLPYVREQVRALQSMSHLPILFTIRTKSQGGKFPDGAVDEALALLLLAVEEGIAYIDVEIEWPQTVLEEITQKKGDTKIVASYHSWTGKVAWTSVELQDRFKAANSFGDIIKLSILSAEVEDCFELGLFVRDYKTKHTKPLLAVGMGANGQLSRITSPISLVTHPLIPFPSAPGQLSLAEVHQARHLMGQLPKKQMLVSGLEVVAERVAGALQVAFDELGYPYGCNLVDPVGSSGGLDTTGLNSTEAMVAVVASEFTKHTGRPAPISVIRQSLERED